MTTLALNTSNITNLNIADLATSNELDSKALKAIAGGYSYWTGWSTQYKFRGTTFLGYVYKNGKLRSKIRKHHSRKWSKTNYFSTDHIV
ncbi:hypothetical protein [Alkalimarinus coralli]|uniref:hypothetical protein n=1 Tax=Alkalimarinus coralli TaxID=2935863 RepID=UPI00202B235C|nr:hypothetical protein [Alkalimarinus coralli]